MRIDATKGKPVSKPLRRKIRRRPFPFEPLERRRLLAADLEYGDGVRTSPKIRRDATHFVALRSDQPPRVIPDKPAKDTSIQYEKLPIKGQVGRADYYLFKVLRVVDEKTSSRSPTSRN